MEVVLLERPTGFSTRDLPLTVGNTYKFHYFDGSNVVISTDDPMLTANIHHGRVKFLEQ